MPEAATAFPSRRVSGTGKNENHPLHHLLTRGDTTGVNMPCAGVSHCTHTLHSAGNLSMMETGTETNKTFQGCFFPINKNILRFQVQIIWSWLPNPKDPLGLQSVQLQLSTAGSTRQTQVDRHDQTYSSKLFFWASPMKVMEFLFKDARNTFHVSSNTTEYNLWWLAWIWNTNTFTY